MRVLITGGGGFIGSHAVVETLLAGHEVVVVDDCSNVAPPKEGQTMPPSLERVCMIVGDKFAANLSFHLGCITDPVMMTSVVKGCDVVMHFAGLKAVGESSVKPLEYYRVNVGGTINLLKCMQQVGCYKIIFSSSATVYKPAKTVEDLPFVEGQPTGDCSCPYARSKLFVEEILSDAAIANQELSCISLRYFNPVGAHPSGLIGEDPQGIPNNLMPYVAQVAIGRRPHLNVFGRDYDTVDGTGVRDYIHVVDLAKGHLAAFSALESKGFKTFNLGTGKGTSVLEMVSAFRKASGQPIATVDCERRAGDVAWMWCCPEKAKNELNWVATSSIDDMCVDLWRFQQANPLGYADNNN